MTPNSAIADRVTPLVKVALRKRYGLLSPVYLALLTVLWQIVKFVIDAQLATTPGISMVDLQRAGVENEVYQAAASGDFA